MFHSQSDFFGRRMFGFITYFDDESLVLSKILKIMWQNCVLVNKMLYSKIIACVIQ